MKDTRGAPPSDGVIGGHQERDSPTAGTASSRGVGLIRAQSLRSSSTLSALQHRDFRIVSAGFLVSGLGTYMQIFGLGWYLVELASRDGTPERGPLYLGLVSATRVVPSLVLGMLAGSLADRMDRRKLLVVSMVAQAVAAGLFAAALLAGVGTLPVVLALSLLSGVVQVFAPVTSMAMVPRLVPAPAIASGVGLLMTTTGGASLVGPLIGGLLIGSIGVEGIMVLNAMSFLGAAGSAFAIRPMPADPRAARGNMLGSIGESLHYVWQHPTLRPLFLLTAVVCIAARPFTQLLPAYAHDSLRVGALELSWLYAATGAGMLGGSFVTAAFGGPVGRAGKVVGSSCVLGAAVGALAVQQSLLPAIALAAIAALALQVEIGLHVTVYQSTTPEQLTGRVTALSATLMQALLSGGSLALGFFGSLVGIAPAWMGGAVLVAIVAVIVYPFLRRASIAAA